jgi:DNA polymerase
MFGQGSKGLIDYATVYGVTLDEKRSRELVDLYRGMYSKVQALWYRCGDCAIKAIQTPNNVVRINDKLRIMSDGRFLILTLPSGRKLHWFAPRVELVQTPWGEKREGVTVMGVNQITRKFQRQNLIGSSIFQSSVQATAADLLISGVQNLERHGYEVVLLVHDEILSVVDKGTRDEDEYGELMCTTPSWADDLPLAYEAWRGPRFRK